MIKECVEALIQQKPLSNRSCMAVAKEMAEGADPIQIAVFLALLRSKGETAEELASLAQAFRQMGIPLALDRPFVDLVGTGGDLKGTVNISTGSALLSAACGIPVVKHGNRAVSSKSGSADVLEALGFNIHLDPLEVQQTLRKTNFAFCFAPNYHPALKMVRPVREALGLPTAFNLLGPLLHPAGSPHLLLGVYDPNLVPVVAQALQLLGTRRSLVFSGHGLDELSCLGKVTALLVTPDAIEPREIDPQRLGLELCALEDLKGGHAKDNAELLRAALGGERTPVSDTLILNAAAALFLYGPVQSLEEGVRVAREVLQSGKTLKQVLAC